MGLFGRQPKVAKNTRLFFATDIHGSEPCFRKFINAGNFYRCQYLILGGDITGKQIVPITRHPDGPFSARRRDQRFDTVDEPELAEVKRLIRVGGDYPVVGSEDEVAELRDPACLERRFRKIVYDSVVDWVTFADEFLSGTGQRVFVAPGNDDFFEIDRAFEGSSVVEFVEGKSLELGEGPPRAASSSGSRRWSRTSTTSRISWPSFPRLRSTLTSTTRRSSTGTCGFSLTGWAACG